MKISLIQIKPRIVYLEHFDLAAGNVKTFRGAITVAVGVGFDLNAERNTFFAAVFLRREFGANAIDFDVDAHFLGGIPGKFNHVQVAIVLDDFVNAVG